MKFPRISLSVKDVLLGVLVVGSSTALGAYSVPSDRLIAGVYGAVAGVLLWGSLLGYRALAGRIGRYTAIAALCTLWGLLFLGAAALSPTCPGSLYTTDSCSGGEIGTWTLSGILLPFLWALIILPPAWIVRTIRRIVRNYRNKETPKAAQPTEGSGSRNEDTNRRRVRKAQRVARRTNRSGR